jgi:branched-chain amino acid transport system substrate-binding protein
MIVAAEAAAKGGGDSEKIRQALSTGTWNSLLGEVKFEAYDGYTNQNKNPMPVTQYQGGKSVTVFPPNVAKAKAVYPFPGWK